MNCRQGNPPGGVASAVARAFTGWIAGRELAQDEQQLLQKRTFPAATAVRYGRGLQLPAWVGAHPALPAAPRARLPPNIDPS